MKLAHFGILIVIFISILLFVFAKNTTNTWQIEIFRLLSQLLAVIGTTLFSISIVLSAKLHSIEKTFGGMDKVFKLHTKLSIFAFLSLLNHPLMLVVSVLPNSSAAINYIIPGTRLDYSSGIISIVIMILLVCLTLYVDMPYQIWKKTHSYMYLVLAIASIHVLLIQSDTSRYLPLKIWILSLMGFGFVIFIWKNIYSKFFVKRYFYKINSLQVEGDILHLSLHTDSKKLVYRPGQFVFLSHRSKRISSEEHPFSIVSIPDDDTLQFGIKMMGDYTKTLPNLQLGDILEVTGPYGVFGEQFLASDNEALLIAGGIGITPIISLISYANKYIRNKKIQVLYCVRYDDKVPFAEKLSKLQTDNIKITLHVSSKMGRVTLDKINTQGINQNKLLVQLCGPQKLMQNLSDQCRKAGIANKRIIYEDFTFL